jgi:hypothetical protein
MGGGRTKAHGRERTIGIAITQRTAAAGDDRLEGPMMNAKG